MVSIDLLRRVWHADRARLLLRTPGPVPLGLAYVLLVETNPFPELVVIFTDYALRISLGTFSILLLNVGQMLWSSYITDKMYIMLLKIIYTECSCCELTHVAAPPQQCCLMEPFLRKLSEMRFFLTRLDTQLKNHIKYTLLTIRLFRV